MIHGMNDPIAPTETLTDGDAADDDFIEEESEEPDHRHQFYINTADITSDVIELSDISKETFSRPLPSPFEKSRTPQPYTRQTKYVASDIKKRSKTPTRRRFALKEPYDVNLKKNHQNDANDRKLKQHKSEKIVPKQNKKYMSKTPSLLATKTKYVSNTAQKSLTPTNKNIENMDIFSFEQGFSIDNLNESLTRNTGHDLMDSALNVPNKPYHVSTATVHILEKEESKEDGQSQESDEEESTQSTPMALSENGKAPFGDVSNNDFVSTIPPVQQLNNNNTAMFGDDSPQAIHPQQSSHNIMSLLNETSMNKKSSFDQIEENVVQPGLVVTEQTQHENEEATANIAPLPIQQGNELAIASDAVNDSNQASQSQNILNVDASLSQKGNNDASQNSSLLDV